MKRSSSKLISKAGSVRNINKQGFKFKFELHVESVDKLTTSSDVCVTWERGSKLLSTKPAKVDKNTRTAHFGGEVLAQEMTLFKKKKDGATFEDKPFKLAVRQGSSRGKIVGKIEINFADYVEIPSFSKRIAAGIASGGRIIMRVVSTFLGEAKRKKGSHGSTSVGSSAFESDVLSSSGYEDNPGGMDTHLNDLDDLDVGDPPMQVSQPPPPIVKKPPPQNVRRPIPPATPNVEEPTVTQNRMFRRPSAPSPKRDITKRSEIPASTNSRVVPGNARSTRVKSDAEVGSTNGPAPSWAEFEKLRRENRGLRRRNEDLQERNDNLEDRAATGNGIEDHTESLQQLMVENTSLRRDVGDLEAKLAREPEYSDVVRDLREAKMALAILTLERDELVQEVRKLRRGR